VKVIGGVGFTSITAGGHHTCGLSSTGQAYCGGENEYGELGIDLFATGPNSKLATPTAVTGAITFSSISAGYSHTCGLTSAGAAYCWGYNFYGQLGDGTNTDRTTPVPVGGGHVFKAISSGGFHTCAIEYSNETYCWGLNAFGQAGGSGNLNLPRAIAAPTFVSISAGTEHTCGLQSGGAAFCWGYNLSGQLGNGTMVNSGPTQVLAVGSDGAALHFISISAGYSHSCGIVTGGAAYCWGADNAGALGDADYNSPFGGAGKPTPQLVANGLTWSEVSAGWITTCGRTTGNAVYCWGADGQWSSGGQYNLARQPMLFTLP
jgi:alpha-tubulin suppressor-like RCC1 family protein